MSVLSGTEVVILFCLPYPFGFDYLFRIRKKRIKPCYANMLIALWDKLETLTSTFLIFLSIERPKRKVKQNGSKNEATEICT